MTWQKRARLAVAIFGIAFAGIVFFAIGEREQPVEAPAPNRIDPKAVIETARGLMNRVTGTRQDFQVTFDRQLAYENGDSKLFNVRIDVKERQGRDFVITGAEAIANEKSREINLTGKVKLAASDGFELSTDSASFHESDGLVRTPGPVSFKKGTMSGTGVGMTYDKNADILIIMDQAHVVMADEGGNTKGEFAAGGATLARQSDYLLLERTMHALHGEQTIDAEHGKANLTANEETIKSIELRGNARVSGGSSAFDSMSARDIDLTYGSDGQTIERVVLAGSGAIALKGTNGGPGRQMLGESLTIALAPDGSVTSAVGRENVQLDLPGSEKSSARHVKAKALDATGEAGKGMTSARFTEDVEYREDAVNDKAPRIARAQSLSVGLDGDAMSDAIFKGRVEFEEDALKASAGEARYEPTKGTLKLSGAGPRVADKEISIEAETIDITLEGRLMIANGGVKTRLQANAKTPGLLSKDQPANVSAMSLEYDGGPGRAVYTGGAQLWQGETAIRGDTITIDQEKGNLSATGGARSTLMFGDASSIGRGEEIRYEDSLRQIAYVGLKPPLVVVPKAPSTPAPAPAPAVPDAAVAAGAADAPATSKTPPGPKASIPGPAQLSGPQGDLKAFRIIVFLAKSESRMDRLEAYDSVNLRVDQRIASGARLTYHALDERYVMLGATTVPVIVEESCRQTTGRALTFFKSTDRIIVDGNEEIRTRTTSGGPCPQPRSE